MNEKIEKTLKEEIRVKRNRIITLEYELEANKSVYEDELKVLNLELEAEK